MRISDRLGIPVRFVAAFSLLLLCVSCGYHMGSLAHPQLKSIAIAEIQNDTKEPLLTEIVREQIAGQFQRDNSLSLKTKEKADCILSCRVTNVKTSAISYKNSTNSSENEYQPLEFRIEVQAEFSVIIPGRSEPFVKRRTVSGSVNYQYNADLQVGRYYALRQACYEMSRMIVEYTTEAW